MKNIKLILIGALAAVTMTSCSFLDLKPNIISSETFYKSQDEVVSGLVGVYGVMNNESFYGQYYSCMMSNVDDLCYFNRPTTNAYVVWYKHDASSAEVYEAWVAMYKGIRNANAFMEAVEQSDFDPKHLYYNEARFLRAYYHFLLAEGWGDVPLKDHSTKKPDEASSAVTPQAEVLDWVIKEMDSTLQYLSTDLSIAPSRITKTAAEGILARVCLFMAGESVTGGEHSKKDYFKMAMDYSYDVISGGKHQLNPDYSEVFTNMISDKYDRTYHESMWEVDFMGHRESAENWSNGRIGDVLGIQSTGATDFNTWKCNYSYAQYDGSLKLWDMYWSDDRTDDEKELPTITDKRQDWNMPPYNYAGGTNPPYGSNGSDGKTSCKASIDKTPYAYDGKTTTQDPLAAPAIRNAGKFRREVQYEGVMDSKRLYTNINYPLLRYSDVLLMYAEAYTEYNDAPSEQAYDCVVEVRDRAGIKTRPYTEYSSKEEFLSLVRNERGRELCFESLRKYDLIRWGIFVKSMNEYTKWTADDRWTKNAKAGYAASIGAAVRPRHILFPIPSVELGVNKDLVQNPLW